MKKILKNLTPQILWEDVLRAEIQKDPSTGILLLTPVAEMLPEKFLRAYKEKKPCRNYSKKKSQMKMLSMVIGRNPLLKISSLEVNVARQAKQTHLGLQQIIINVEKEEFDPRSKETQRIPRKERTREYQYETVHYTKRGIWDSYGASHAHLQTSRI